MAFQIFDYRKTQKELLAGKEFKEPTLFEQWWKISIITQKVPNKNEIKMVITSHSGENTIFVPINPENIRLILDIIAREAFEQKIKYLLYINKININPVFRKD